MTLKSNGFIGFNHTRGYLENAFNENQFVPLKNVPSCLFIFFTGDYAESQLKNVYIHKNKAALPILISGPIF